MRTMFRAPWSPLVYLMTAIGVGVLGVASGIMLLTLEEQTSYQILILVVLLGTLMGCIPFACRGYELEGGDLVIRRIGWSKRLPLGSLKNASVLSQWPMIRAGNGGLFGFSGLFYYRGLGWVRLVGNDITKRAVLLEFSEGRSWVVTPDDPNEFVEAVKTAARR